MDTEKHPTLLKAYSDLLKNLETHSRLQEDVSHGLKTLESIAFCAENYIRPNLRVITPENEEMTRKCSNWYLSADPDMFRKRLIYAMNLVKKSNTSAKEVLMSAVLFHQRVELTQIQKALDQQPESRFK